MNDTPIKWTAAETAALKPREINPDGTLVTVSQWAERHRYVTTGPHPGLWSNKLTPYLTEILDKCSDPWCQKIILCFAPQSGKTQVAFNFLCWAADQQPDPMMYVMPDEKVARRMSRRRIVPMLKSSPRTAALFSTRLHDVGSLGVSLINGMDIMLVWSTSPAELASESVRYMIFDETDKYPEFAGREGDPISLGEVRTTTYGDDRKILYLSTPTNESGIIARAIELEAEQVRRYQARCPVCTTLQLMKFRDIYWPPEIKDPRIILRQRSARYKCPTCQALWTDHIRDQAVQAGCWLPDNDLPHPRAIGYILPSWYSPFVSLSEAVGAYLAGLQDPTKLWNFITQHKAEPWKETIVERAEEQIMALKNDLPPNTLPANTIALTAAFDMQLHGFWYLVRAWDANLNSHLVTYGYLESWSDISTVLDTPWQSTDRRTHKIWRAALDTGGGAGATEDWSRTQEAYDYLRQNLWRRTGQGGGLYGIKGMSKRMGGAPVTPKAQDYTSKGKRISGGLTLYFLDTDTLKQNFFQCITATGQQGVTHRQISMHADTGHDYARQILSEEQRQDRKGKVYWHQIRRDNHLLDCEMMQQGLTHAAWHPSLDMVKALIGAAAPQVVAPVKERAGVNPYTQAGNPFDR